jgi:hypothetical protein
MTELRRWLEEGATADEIALLEASRQERPSAWAQARTFRALGAAAATTIGTATLPAAAAAKGGLTFLSKIVILSLVGGGVMTGGVVVRAARHRAQASLTSAVARPAPAAPARNDEPANTVTTPLTVPSPSSSPAIAISPSDGHAPPRLLRRPASSSDSTLARELKALELPYRALEAHDPRSALALLDRYRVQFPGGSLSSEATVLRARALLESGDRAEAQALVDAFVSAHPKSPYARRLEDTVRGK